MSCTNRQQDLIDDHVVFTMPHAICLMIRAEQLHKAIVALPYTNERLEPVVHGDNMAMIARRDYLIEAVRALMAGVPDNKRSDLEGEFKVSLSKGRFWHKGEYY